MRLSVPSFHYVKISDLVYRVRRVSRGHWGHVLLDAARGMMLSRRGEDRCPESNLMSHFLPVLTINYGHLSLRINRSTLRSLQTLVSILLRRVRDLIPYVQSPLSNGVQFLITAGYSTAANHAETVVSAGK